jgi:hypothetical protein
VPMPPSHKVQRPECDLTALRRAGFVLMMMGREDK